MNEVQRRWVVTGIGAALIGLLSWWIARNTYWEDVLVPLPPRGEAAFNPFYSAQRLAESLGATTEWRHSLGTPPAPDSVIVLHDWHWSLIPKRRVQLEQWVQAGGRLVVDHTLVGGEEQFRQFSGLSIKYEDDDEPVAEDEQAIEEESADDEDFCDTLRITHARKASDIQAQYSACELGYSTTVVSDRPVFWALKDSLGLQAARADIGKGSATLLNASPFGNRDLLEFDHAALFVTLTQLRRGDHIVFLSEEEQTTLLELIWMHGKPVVVLLALFILFALWRGALRFGPPAAPTPQARRSLAEQIRGTGVFMLQFDGNRTLHAAMRRALDHAARRRIVGYDSLPTDKRMAALAAATQLPADKLAQAINYNGKGNTHELQHAIALIETARRQLRPQPKAMPQ